MLSEFGFTFDAQIVLLLVIGGVVTLINRTAGHYILRRFEPIPYRVEAALEAVPIAVIICIIVPSVVNGGPIEWITLLFAMALSLRFGFLTSCGLALVLLLLLRNSGL